MANQPDENTVSTSFTLPRQLFAAVKRKAKAEMTNQSDIVRRALMNYLPSDERELVLKEIAGDQVDLSSAKPVDYKGKSNSKPTEAELKKMKSIARNILARKSQDNKP